MNPSRDKNSRLGRGFSALMPNAPITTPDADRRDLPRAGVLELPIEAIVPEKGQPRRKFDDQKIEELAASIRAKGVMQPILVRREGERYRIIAGERRWRASQRAGLQIVPALVKEVTERQAFEMALIENIQREDLNAIEEAEAYRRLIDEHHLTQEACAERVGKDRSSVSNALRLLRLPDELKRALAEGSLNMGHARAILGLEDDAKMSRTAAEVIAKQLSVRQTEQLVRKQKRPDDAPAPEASTPKPETQIRAIEERLQRALGTKVRLQARNKGRGTIEIQFFSNEELERLMDRLLRDS